MAERRENEKPIEKNAPGKKPSQAEGDRKTVERSLDEHERKDEKRQS